MPEHITLNYGLKLAQKLREIQVGIWIIRAKIIKEDFKKWWSNPIHQGDSD